MMKQFSAFTTMAAALLLLSPKASNAQLVIDNIYDVPTMAYDFFDGTCVDVTNVTWQGSPDNMSFFEGSLSNIGLDMGILLTSGNVFDAVGPNDNSATTTYLGLAGDTDLDGLSGFATYDAAILEMDIVPDVDTIFFDYVFASEEYSEYVGSAFNDVFAFFISGPGITGVQNIALVPGSTDPVAINNVNCLNGSSFYVCNDPMNTVCAANYSCPGSSASTTVEYDGFTTPVNAYAVVIPGETYHVKIAVGDAGDGILDSGIFLGIGSLCGDGQKPVADYNYVPSALDVDFENLAMYVREYYWDFGDGNISAERNPIHEFAAPGIYEVTMVATNYKGSDTVTKIVDLLGTSVDENSLEGINLVSNPVTSVISFENKLTEEVEFYLFDVSGKLVVNEIVSGDFSVSAEQLPSGIYFAELRSEGKTFRAKVMKQ